MPDYSPYLRGKRRPDCQAVVLVLHGGAEFGTQPVPWRKPAVLRMIPFARAISRAVGPRATVLRVRNHRYGWNGTRRDPVTHASGILDHLRTEFPDRPFVLVGHSMGGRTALHLAGEPDVTAVVALAPWVHADDEVIAHPAVRALLLHGENDLTTDPAYTKRWADRAIGAGIDARYELVPDEGHAMLRRARRWHRESANFIAAAIDTQKGR